MSRNKKILIILALLMIFLMVFIVLKLKENNDSFNQVSSIPAAPKFPNYYSGPLNIKFDINLNKIDFPDTISSLKSKQNPALTETETQDIAQSFGFDKANYKITKDTLRGNTFIWNKGNESLVIYSKSNQITYSNYKVDIPANKQLSDQEILDIARNHVKTVSWYKDSNLDNYSITYLDIGPSGEELRTSEKPSADIYLVNLFPINSKYKLLGINPMKSPLSVYVSIDGTITKSEITNLQLEETLEKYPIKTEEEIMKSIAKSQVASVDEGNFLIYDLQNSELNEIIIKNAEIAYLMDEANKNLYLPVFLFKGTTNLDNREVEISLYLFAYKQ